MDQLVISYGGLRGAIAFALAYVLLEDKFVCTGSDEAHPTVTTPFMQRDLILSTTVVIVLFTVFIQGSTIKPLLRWLKIQLATEKESKGFERLNDMVVDQIMRVFEAITQVHGTNRFRDYYSGIDRRFHNWLVKPGGDYQIILEITEEEHMRGVLEHTRQQRALAMIDEADKNLGVCAGCRVLWSAICQKGVAWLAGTPFCCRLIRRSSPFELQTSLRRRTSCGRKRTTTFRAS